MLKRLIFVALFCTGVVLGAGLYSRVVFQQSTPEQGTLQAMAFDAKAGGETEVYLTKNILFQGVDNLDLAISKYTIVEATPLLSNSYITNPASIGTWYKFRVDGVLSQKPWPQCSECTTADDPPADFLPLNSDEIAILHPGAVKLVDDVTFFQDVPDFPDFSIGQKYLLFLDYDSTKKVGSIGAGPVAIYMITGYGTLVPVYQAETETNNPIASEFASRYGNSVDLLSIALGNPAPPTPPSGSSNVTGFIDNVDANGTATGWAIDPDVSYQAVSVHFYIDGPAGSGIFAGAATADIPRPDVNNSTNYPGHHGYSFSIPEQFQDGRTHSLYVHGIDATGNSNALLQGVPKYFVVGTPPPCDPNEEQSCYMDGGNWDSYSCYCDRSMCNRYPWNCY